LHACVFHPHAKEQAPGSVAQRVTPQLQAWQPPKAEAGTRRHGR